MNSKRTIVWAAVLACGCVAACGGGSERISGKVGIDGSSTVYPITEAVAEEFGTVQPRVRVTVGVSGTGGGFKRFVIGETDISNASRPIQKDELEKARDNGVEFIELPVAYDGLSIVVNKENDWATDITIDELKRVFLEEGAAKTWQDVRSGWPVIPIKIYSPGTDSGTFDYFKEVVAHEASFRGDMSVSEDDNVLVKGVAGDKGAIGFFGCAYYFENQDKLRALAVVNEQGKAVLPTPETIRDGTYNPLSRPLFIYVNARSAKRPEVDTFVKFYLEQGPELATEVGYVNLPDEVYQRAASNYTSSKTGTQFTNEQMEKVSGPVTEVYQ